MSPLLSTQELQEVYLDINDILSGSVRETSDFISSKVGKQVSHNCLDCEWKENQENTFRMLSRVEQLNNHEWLSKERNRFSKFTVMIE